MTGPRLVPLAAGLAWVLALGVPLALGEDRLERLLTGRAQDPMVELGVTGEPEVTTDPASVGTVRVRYTVRLTGVPGGTVTLETGQGTDPAAPVTGTKERVDLVEGETLQRSVDVRVDCRTRTKVGVNATGDATRTSSIYVWVRPLKDSKGHVTCSLV